MKKQIRVGEVTDEEPGCIPASCTAGAASAKLPILHRNLSESHELKGMKLKFEQVERQGSSQKALARLKVQLKKDSEERGPRGDGAPAAEEELGGLWASSMPSTITPRSRAPTSSSHRTGTPGSTTRGRACRRIQGRRGCLAPQT